MTLDDKLLDAITKLTRFADPKFSFNEKDHRYHYGYHELLSMTKFCKQFVPKVDWAAKKAGIAARQRCSVDQVQGEWDMTAYIGTMVHLCIEHYLRGWPLPPPPPEEHMQVTEKIGACFAKWLKFYETEMQHVIPIALELRTFVLRDPFVIQCDGDELPDSYYGFGGTQDFVAWVIDKETGLVKPIDWKTGSRMTQDGDDYPDTKMLLPPFDRFRANKKNEGSIQTSGYRVILEDTAGIETGDAELIHVPVDGPVRRHVCRDMRKEFRQAAFNPSLFLPATEYSSTQK